MVTTHNLGFPRIGARRELKFALESCWQGATTAAELEQVAADLRRRHWQQQSRLDLAPVGDFALYDQALDMGITLGNVPERVRNLPGSALDTYFRIARGRAPADSAQTVVAAGEMTKWFDTNYHYIVPEFSAATTFALDPARLIGQLAEARQLGVKPKPVIIGPLTYLWLGKSRDGEDKLALLERLLPVYRQLLQALAQQGVDWVQIDEPALVTELSAAWQQAYRKAYQYLADSGVKLLLATYFGKLADNLELTLSLPVQGLHLDAVNARGEAGAVVERLAPDKILSLGVINGRNIWKTDLNAELDWLGPVYRQLQERLWLAPSCSLLHVPVDLDSETALDPEIKSWLAFAQQKLDELDVLARGLGEGRDAVAGALADNARAIDSRRQSRRVHDPAVEQAVSGIVPDLGQRRSDYPARAEKQHRRFNLPAFPTTTIGSFPQTPEIRQARALLRQGELDGESYRQAMEREIEHCVREQERLGLDVLVHGEAERNDMVEYFGEQLEGYVFTRFGWVQSYGSRCVKPPVIYGDVSRPEPMTVVWSRFAQSLSDKPMKGMLTGPVTLLNWSFVRDDQPRRDTCLQLALAIRAEVLDLERAGIGIIQIDEPALREGLPLRRAQWHDYLDWAVEAFRISANGVADDTQIHTHMCYSEFNDIMAAIAGLDADVITIETSRSAMELLDAFDEFHYPNAIGPGVYDIHSPNIPGVDAMVELMKKAAAKIPAERLWVNPDCGLKTRRWAEVTPALENMIAAAGVLRERG